MKKSPEGNYHDGIVAFNEGKLGKARLLLSFAAAAEFSPPPGSKSIPWYLDQIEMKLRQIEAERFPGRRFNELTDDEQMTFLRDMARE